MSELFNNVPVISVLIMLCAAVVLAIQYLCGYKNWKALGFILPALFLGSVIYFFVKGVMTFSVQDILRPLVGFLVLALAYENGAKAAKARRKKELDKMKAQDHLS
ncbi:MAG: hypothetical protein Q4P72_04920 [Eubacteriales bacterium]|nr:hypothetical protein [Eubacteriales bacterium]